MQMYRLLRVTFLSLNQRVLHRKLCLPVKSHLSHVVSTSEDDSDGDDDEMTTTVL